MENKNKRISKETTDIRLVGSELSSLLGMFCFMYGDRTPVSEDTKKKAADIIKDYCDTIVKYVDLF